MAKPAAKKVAAPAPTAARAAPQSVSDAFQQLQQTKTPAETLSGISDIYERFLTQKDPQKVVEALGYLRGVRFFDLHVWRVHQAAFNSKETTASLQHAWLLTALLLLTHALRATETAIEVAAAWAFTQSDGDAWRSFVGLLTDQFLAKSKQWTLRENAALIQFLIYSYSHLEIDAVRSEMLKLVSLPMWSDALSPSQRAIEFTDQPKLARHWKKLMGSDDGAQKVGQEPAKKRRKADEDAAAKTQPSHREKAFLIAILDQFVHTLATKSDADDALQFVALVLSLLTDLLGQLSTRRFLPVVLRRKHILTRVRQSPFVHHALEVRPASERSALSSQIDRFECVLWFPIEPQTGKSLTTLQATKEASTKTIQALQLAAFAPQYRETSVASIAVVPVSSILDRARFQELLESIVRADRKHLEQLSVTMGVTRDAYEASTSTDSELVHFLLDEYASPAPQSSPPALPTEIELWSDALSEGSSSVYGVGPGVLFPLVALPKLGRLQYLNVTDLLQRTHELHRLDAAYAIRRDLEAAIRPLDAVRSLARNGETVFRGFHPLAVPLQTAFSVLDVGKPRIGGTAPATVTAEFDVELDTRHDIHAWDRYAPREVVYLVTLRPTHDEAAEAMGFSGDVAMTSGQHFAEDYGVLYVRCAEVVSVCDEYGTPIEDTEASATSRASVSRGRKRTVKVALDGAQYKRDLDSDQLGAYEYVNLLIRREDHATGRSDAITTTLQRASRDTAGGALPAWLYDLVLGYGDPDSASFEAIAKRKLQAKHVVPLYAGVFVDAAHAVECCSLAAGHAVQLVDEDDQPLTVQEASGPYSLTVDVATMATTLKAYRNSKPVSAATSLPQPSLRLSQEQAHGVIRGSADGLTIVCGPGRADALAYTIQNLVQSTAATDEKILVVAPSSTALDPLLAKLQGLPYINQSSVVRLGDSTETDAFSCQQRINMLLARRLELLQHVGGIAQWMERVDGKKYAGISASVAYSCENAQFFFRFYLAPLCESARNAATASDALLHGFYVENAADSTDFKAFITHVEAIFTELARLQAFELLQTPRQRQQVYLMQHARVVAVSSGQLAAQFEQLQALKLVWTTVIIDHANSVGESDSLAPLLLASDSTSRLRRLIIVGDENGASAEVETPALKAYAKLDTSLFSRLRRLGVPVIETKVGEAATSTPTKPTTTKPTPPQRKKPTPPKK